MDFHMNINILRALLASFFIIHVQTAYYPSFLEFLTFGFLTTKKHVTFDQRPPRIILIPARDRQSFTKRKNDHPQNNALTNPNNAYCSHASIETQTDNLSQTAPTYRTTASFI